jgi:hypothetical protein
MGNDQLGGKGSDQSSKLLQEKAIMAMLNNANTR